MIPPVIADASSKWAVGVLVAIACFLAGYSHGQHVLEGEKAAAERDIAIAYASEIVARQATADQLAAENQAIRATKAPKDRLITKEITRYVEVTPPDRRVVLPATWRVRHDAAARGDLPEGSRPGPMADGAAEAAQAATPVDDATALETVGENYAECRDTIAKLEGWQRRQRALEGARP